MRWESILGYMLDWYMVSGCTLFNRTLTSLHVGVERTATAEIDLVEWLLGSESLV